MSDTASATPNVIKRFFTSLFDFSFKTFVSRRLAGIFYGIGLASIAITAIVMFFTGVGSGITAMASPYGPGIGGGLLLIAGSVVLVPIATFIAVIILRVWIEAVVALIAVAENTASLRK